jgi:hypothetical protein
MNELSQLSLFFLIAMGFGLSLFSAVVSTSLTGAGFLRLLQSIVLSSLVICGVISYFHQLPTTLLISLALNIGLVSFIYKSHQDQKSKLMWVLYIVQNGLYLWSSLILYYSNTQLLMNFYLSTLLIGITTYAMVLGHYYLVVPKLSEKPLLSSLQILWVAMILKMGLSGVGLIKDYAFFEEGTIQGAGYMFNWILLSMRVLWGYAALFILSIFAWKLCRMRSIQSATGVLYVMVFFMIVGEMISGYFYFKYGLFL